jgi:hypothetical protein
MLSCIKIEVDPNKETFEAALERVSRLMRAADWGDPIPVADHTFYKVPGEGCYASYKWGFPLFLQRVGYGYKAHFTWVLPHEGGYAGIC